MVGIRGCFLLGSLPMFRGELLVLGSVRRGKMNEDGILMEHLDHLMVPLDLFLLVIFWPDERGTHGIDSFITMKNNPLGNMFVMSSNHWTSKSWGTYTLPKFNSSPLKNGGWKTSLSYWVLVTFQGLSLLNFGGVHFPSIQKLGDLGIDASI